MGEFVWEREKGSESVWGEGQAAFLLWASDWECGLRRERAHAPNGLKSYHPHTLSFAHARTSHFFCSTLRLEG
jgi:hypothetical protein